MPPNSRKLLALGNFSGLKSGEPATNRFPERFNFKPAMNFRETIEFEQPCLKQVSRSQ